MKHTVKLLISIYLLHYTKKSGSKYKGIYLGYILGFCFWSLNESTCQTRKNDFILLQKLFLFLRISNFRILHFQISSHHQMPKHEERNLFPWITWEETQSVKEIWPIYVMLQKKVSFKNSIKTAAWKQAFLSLQIIKPNFFWKRKVLKEATYIRYITA